MRSRKEKGGGGSPAEASRRQLGPWGVSEVGRTDSGFLVSEFGVVPGMRGLWVAGLVSAVQREWRFLASLWLSKLARSPAFPCGLSLGSHSPSCGPEGALGAAFFSRALAFSTRILGSGSKCCTCGRLRAGFGDGGSLPKGAGHDDQPLQFLASEYSRDWKIVKLVLF